MKKFSYRLATVIILTLALTVCFGCKKKEKPIKPADQLYNEGISYMTVGKWGNFFSPADYERAREAFETILYEHPTSRYAPLAELRVADTYYESGDYDSSGELYEMWWRHHLGRPELPFAIYRAGMSFYHLMLSKDRDQTYTKRALKHFYFLTEKFPNDEYATAVGEKINILEVRLAQHEMYVGKFYYRHRRWWSAIDRFQNVLIEYPKKGFDEEAMYYIWNAYRKLDRFQEAGAVYNKMVRSYPTGVFTKRAESRESGEKSKGVADWFRP